jgi:hypothetical protein
MAWAFSIVSMCFSEIASGSPLRIGQDQEGLHSWLRQRSESRVKDREALDPRAGLALSTWALDGAAGSAIRCAYTGKEVDPADAK